MNTREVFMASTPTPLKLAAHHGYRSFTTTWWDAQGHHRCKRFGREGVVTRRAARAAFNNWRKTEFDAKAHVRAPDDPNLYTVAMLCRDYEKYAATVYRKHGDETSHMINVRLALRQLETAHGDDPVEAIGAPQIAKLRDGMVKGVGRHGKGCILACSTVNGRLKIIRQAFGWGRLYGQVPPATAYDVSLVKPLKPGRGEAKPARTVLPVPDDVLEATLNEAPQTVADMARVQVWTGMRSGELCQLRPADIVVDGDVWLYYPQTHKSEHHGKDRVIPVGPQAQKILAPYIAQRKLTDFVFLPEEAHRERLEQIGFEKVMAYQLSRSTFKPGRAFRHDTYYNKIAYACDRAFDPDGERRAKGDYSHRWHPHRLRHNAATRMREATGIEAASHVLGHSQQSTTLIYAQASVERMKEVARIAG